jgi:hypothetical protein
MNATMGVTNPTITAIASKKKKATTMTAIASRRA